MPEALPVTRWLRHRAAKPLLAVLLGAPLLALLAGAATGGLGPNPAEALIRRSGEWTLRCLCATLAVTPLRQATGWHALVRFRRLLGLSCFGWGLLHLSAYAWLDMGLVAADIVRDIGQRPFILVGFLAMVTLVPLAATSFDAAIRRLGARRWQALHRAVYAVALLALLHFYWMRAGKNDFADWWLYAAVLGALLGWRLLRRLRSRAGPPSPG